ncbi:uncharacterized protein KQ657_001737 [Scheffersomyces spartinae]|uniref:Actin binding protein n=1 Tax=Scheffersomyces spartinae TaxID=45513 RepID=A0A9P7V6L6_9ASCO|nr:uncharacterized protein KQ657_001737 [Scheffersomyces spartinae]KAG7192339.1 hypothetical protein KQ657_001737 [Scheffersomyces spartinae]
MEKIDLSTNLKRIQEAYNKVVGGDPEATYVVYSVDKKATLDLKETGDGDLDEFISQFEEGHVQYGLSRLTVPGSDVTKILLLGWCPDSAPAKLRMSFAQNTAEFSKVLNGYHVQIVARDEDDLDANEFLRRVCAAAGANYSAQSSSKSAGGGSSSTSTPIRPKPVAAPIKPSFVPKSTGKPVAASTSSSSVAPAPAPTIGKSFPAKSEGDEWGGEKELEVRDFSKEPLEEVPSAYKPLKVDIAELRKGKSDTVSSTPVPFKSTVEDEKKKDDEPPKTFSERMSSFNRPESKSSSSSDGRLTSLPKPKPSNTVSLRFTPTVTTSGTSPKFGSKPSIVNPVENRNDKIVGGFKIFGAENGKTPAQLWAEKKGKFKSVPQEDEAADHSHVESDMDKLTVNDEEKEESVVKPSDHVFDKFAKQEEDDEDEDRKPVQFLPARNLPPPPIRTVVRPAEVEEDEDKSPSLPSRSEPEHVEEEEEEEETPAPPSLPSRSQPQPEEEPEEEEGEEGEAPAPVLPSRSGASGSLQAIAEYDCEADESNEISFKEGDLIVDIEQIDEEWWKGKHSKTGNVGLFPSSYVSLKSEETSSAATGATPPAPPARASPAPAAADIGISAVAEYDCEADEDNELSFKEGDVIIEIEKIDADWWKGKHSTTGAVGLFPASYVTIN